MSSRHDREILIRILSACACNDLDKLKVMSLAYLSDKKAVAYLKHLVSDGLLKYDSELKRYRTAEAGLKLLDGYT